MADSGMDMDTGLHHQQDQRTQQMLQKQEKSLTETLTRMGNPFLDEFKELVCLDSRNCQGEHALQELNSLEDTEKRRYNNFVKSTLDDRTKSIHMQRIISQEGKKVKVLQNNVALFGQLYVAIQSREGDLEEFFAHEIQLFPPSLSDFGKLPLPSKKLTFCTVCTSQMILKLPQFVTAKFWMELYLSTVYQQQLSKHSISMQMWHFYPLWSNNCR